MFARFPAPGRWQRLILFGALLFATVLIGRTATVATAVAAPALIDAVTSNCTSAAGSATFSWRAGEGATSHWVDLSVLDDTFAPGTFAGYGPLGADQTSLRWDGLEPGTVYFWRVNASTPAGWFASSSGSFVACGGPALLPGSIVCEADGTATVHFRWAPSSVPSDVQWLDLTVHDNGFAPGTFLSAGPIPTNAQSLTWPGIEANRMHYFRVSAHTAWGWQFTHTSSFLPCPEPSREPSVPPAIPGPELGGERWVLIDIARQEATAMIGDRPLYTVYVTTGKPGWETPKGTFHILYRVADETMTSSSIGAEEYYVLEDVLYTQYFTTEGHALHLNYWRPDYYFGEIASSHGCVGMRLSAAEFFWRFATYGTRVTII
jgi:hypothetical protein